MEVIKFYTEVPGFVKKIYVPETKLARVASPEEPNSNPIAKTHQEAVYRDSYL